MKVAGGCGAAAVQLVTACCPEAERRPEHWQAQAAAAAADGSANAAVGAPASAEVGGSSEAGSERGDGGSRSQHLSFRIPQHRADLPALFEALEHGRQGGCSANEGARRRRRRPRGRLASRAC